MKLTLVFFTFSLATYFVSVDISVASCASLTTQLDLGLDSRLVLITPDNNLYRDSSASFARDESRSRAAPIPYYLLFWRNFQWHSALVNTLDRSWIPRVNIARLHLYFLRHLHKRHNWLVEEWKMEHDFQNRLYVHRQRRLLGSKTANLPFPSWSIQYAPSYRSALFLDVLLNVRTCAVFLDIFQELLIELRSTNPEPITIHGPRYLGGRHRNFSSQEIQPYIMDKLIRLRASDQLRYIHQVTVSAHLDILISKGNVCAEVPLRVLVPLLNKKQLEDLTRKHSCGMARRQTADALRRHLEEHVCTCERMMSVFTVVSSEHKTA